jgi:hypothetical protein
MTQARVKKVVSFIIRNKFLIVNRFSLLPDGLSGRQYSGKPDIPPACPKQAHLAK